MTLVGPESTGKTTTSRALAAALDAEWVPEAARLYVEERLARAAAEPGAELPPFDVGEVARRQVALEEAAEAHARRDGRRVVVRDADLVSTTVYARWYHGACPAWIEAAARARAADLYLLCDVDLPWEPDPGQRDHASGAPPARRALYERFAAAVDALAALGVRSARVAGAGPARLAAALAAVRALGR